MLLSSSDSTEDDVIADLEVQKRENVMAIHSKGERLPKMGVVESDNYFVQKLNATDKLALSSHRETVAALRMLAFGVSSDIWGEYLAIRESTILEIVQRFCLAELKRFGKTYLRHPAKVDIKRLYEQNEPRGFPGTHGSIDCMYWKWKNCSTTWQGQHKGHADGANLIFEAVASYDTWIWNAFFGIPGSYNDLNVLHRSTFFHESLHGKAPSMPYVVNNHRYKHSYYLADGIYPPIATIVQAIRVPTNNHEREFKRKQEACRKDVEHAFGILQSRWGFIREPTRLWDKYRINEVMKTCIVLHIQIVQDERRCKGWQNEYEQYVL